MASYSTPTPHILHTTSPPPRFNLIPKFANSVSKLTFKNTLSSRSPRIVSYGMFEDREFVFEENEGQNSNFTFNEAVKLFNERDYYTCHDLLEALWNDAEDPLRTLIHGILQCAVGFHHLFNQNHKGAMMELGEGLCKLRKMNFRSGPFHQLEMEVSAALEFIYQTQIELAACTDDFCIAMDQSERSYQLLGGYAAGQHLYHLETGPKETMYIVFCPGGSYGNGEPPRVKLPTLHATEEHLIGLES